MGDNFKKVRPGEPLKIPAETFNTFIDAAQYVRAHRHDRAGGTGADVRRQTVVPVRNDSGGDRGRFDVLAIDGSIITAEENLAEFKNRVALVGVTPQYPDHLGQFAVLLEPVAAGRIGRGCVSGVCPARVNLLREWHQYADIADEEHFFLQSGQSGAAQILSRYPEEGAGAKWAVVRLGLPAHTVDLYELTVAMTCDGDVKEFVCGGKPVVFDEDSQRYQLDTGAQSEQLWLPTAFRNPADEAFGLLSYAVGQRVYTQLRHGRREILSPPLDLWRFEMVDALSAGGSATALAIGWDPAGLIYTDDLPGQGELVVIVHDYQGRFSKMATESGDVGALGWMKYLPDRDAWEILTMATPGDFWGTLDADLSQTTEYATVTMQAMLDGYNVFGYYWTLANGGAKITAYNPVGGGNFASYWWAGKAGDRVFCHWDIENAKYWILLVEPNNQDYQSLTITTPSGDKTIQLPPWTTIS